MSAQVVADMGDVAAVEDAALLLRDDELLALVGQVAAADPELLGAAGSNPRPQSQMLDGSPQSFATLPPWVVPDRVALHSCLDTLQAEPDGRADAQAAPQRTRELESARHESLSLSLPLSRDKGDERLRSRRRRERRKGEVAQLRERIRELEGELAALQRQGFGAPERPTESAVVFSLVPTSQLLAGTGPSGTSEADASDSVHGGGSDDCEGRETQMETRRRTPSVLWKRIAVHHKEELRRSRFKNVRLRAMAEQQLRVLKQLEIAFRNAERPDWQAFGLSERALHRGLFGSEAAVFESLQVHLAAQYMETDRVYKTNGLAGFEGDMAQTASPRVLRGADAANSQVYLENMESKVFPFDIQAVNEAVWHCLTNADATFHPGFYQVFEATTDIATVKISDIVRLPNAETRVTVWLTARRYQEDERIVTVWNAMVETEGSLSMKLHERGWNVLRPLLSASAGRNPSMCITQTVMRVSPVTNARFDVKDVAMGTLANVLIGCYHRTVIVMHHVLEKLLLTEFRTLTCGS